MSEQSFEQQQNEMILSQLKLQRLQSHKNQVRVPHRYIQVDYMKKKIMKMNPEEAQQYQKTVDQQNIKEYLEDTKKDKLKYDTFKFDLSMNFFKINNTRQVNKKQYTMQEQPIELIKSFSQPSNFLTKNKLPHIPEIDQLRLSASSYLKRDSKARYADDFQQLLNESQKLTSRKSRFKLRGGTMIEREKKNQSVMQQQKIEIINIIKNRNYSLNRPKKLQEISNKQKYNIKFLEYLKTKTKIGLDRNLFQKKIRKISGKLENFQQFILREGKLKDQGRSKLQNFYIKMREQFRRIERSLSPHRR